MVTEGIAVSDFQGLQRLKQKAMSDADKALPEVAKQFEAIFLQSMLKTMRMGQHFLDESSPFRGKYQETFQDMLDGQYASNIANSQGIGLAQMLTKQLAKNAAAAPQQGLPASRIGMPALHQTEVVKPPMAMPSPQSNAGDNQQIDEFVKSIWPYARQAASALGLDPKILMAQAALETGWGQFITKDSQGASSNNLFNIKSSTKSGTNAIEVKTTEYIADTPIKTTASFKKYASAASSFADYVSLIKENGRYGQALAHANDPQRYIKALHEAGYATDPQYANKILSIYHGNELQQALERNGFTAVMDNL